jgi:hypothetical protein
MPQQGPTADLESEQRAHRKHAGECHPQQEIAISVLHLIAVTALYQAQHLNGNVSQLLLKMVSRSLLFNHWLRIIVIVYVYCYLVYP